MNMSAREKSLVIILAVLVILLGGFKFLIEPEIGKLLKASTEYAKAVVEKQRINNNSTIADSIDADNTNLQDKINGEAGIFLPELESDKVHIFFQKIMDNAGISADMFIMTDKMAMQISNQSFNVADITYPAKTAAENIVNIEKGNVQASDIVAMKQSGTAQSGTAQTEIAQSSGVLQPDTFQQVTTQQSSQSAAQVALKQTAADLVEMVTVIIQFQSQYDRCMKVLDEIKNSGRTVRVTSLSILETQPGQLTVNISVECYGIVKLTDNDPLNEKDLPAPAGRYNPFQP